MDKDATIELEERTSSDESVEVDEISFEDLMRSDEDTAKSNDATNKILNDLIATKKDEADKAPSPAASTIKSVTIPQSSNNNVIQNKLVATANTPAFVRIAPRSNASSTPSTTTTAVKASNGKIIYLQRPGGSSVPVRVPAAMTSNSSSSNNSSKSTVQIHVIRTPDGNLVPVKSSKGINIPNVSQLAGKKIITTTSGAASSGQMLIKTPIKTISPASSSSTTTTTSALGSALIASVEASKPKVRHVIAGKSILAGSVNGSSSGGTKMLMQSPTGTRQLMVSSQNVIKLSPTTSSGQLQAIQIPGKSGLQYVRVLNNTSGIAHKIGTSDTTTPKYTVVRQTKPPMKFMVQSPLNDKERQKMMTTVPTYRRINDVVKSKDGSEGSLVQTHKISQINSQIRRFSTSGDAKATASGSKYIVLSKSSLIRSTVTSQNQKITHLRQLASESQKQEAAAGRQSPPPAKRLYTVLKPTSVHKDVKDIKVKAKAEPIKPVTTVAVASRSSRPSPPPSDDGVTIRRKHCNCTKSQCLKLYCDCFANGEFCQDCNCKDCLNNLDNEDERQKAIRICLERNPNSFKPKITAATNESDQRLHNKGCNCKRSGCLKNYCECYEAKIPCSSNCKCVGCRNVDDHPDLDMDIKKCSIPTAQTLSRSKRSYDDMIKQRHSNHPSAASSSSVPTSMSAAIAASAQATACGPQADKQPCNFITQEVVDATIQCLIAQADECKKSSLTAYQTEKMVMEELGRCLVEIIDFSIRNTDQN